MKNATLVLFENVQFIYELRLAQLELKNFNIEFEISPRFREFIVINEPQSWETLRKRLAYFKLVNGLLLYHSKK